MNLPFSLDSLRAQDVKRALPMVGILLIILGFVKRSPLGLVLALVGGGLVLRSVREQERPELEWSQFQKGLPTLRSIPHDQGVRVEYAVTIDRPVEELYRFWRNLENLPRIMHHVEQVTVIDDLRSHWVARAPAGFDVSWDAEIINEVENEVIGWRSIESSQVSTAGSVRFYPATGGRGTVVRVNLKYDPPGGKLGAIVARLLGSDPSITVGDDLRRFKQLMEAGEIATVEGQPTGDTSVLSK